MSEYPGDARLAASFVRAATLEDIDLLIAYLEDVEPPGNESFAAGYATAVRRVRDLRRELS